MEQMLVFYTFPCDGCILRSSIGDLYMLLALFGVTIPSPFADCQIPVVSSMGRFNQMSMSILKNIIL